MGIDVRVNDTGGLNDCTSYRTEIMGSLGNYCLLLFGEDFRRGERLFSFHKQL